MILLATAAALASGCSPLNISKKLPWPLDWEKPAMPTKVVAVWTDTVLYQPGQKPKRGFGGRLMFYDNKDKEPIKVEGVLVVYAFEEEPKEPNKVKPDRKYVFTKEQFAKHYSKSNLGHSYSVWVPWDDVGGAQKEISMIARFIPAGGDPVVGDQAKHVLPGTTTELARPQDAHPPLGPAGVLPGPSTASNGAGPAASGIAGGRDPRAAGDLSRLPAVSAQAGPVRPASHEETARGPEGAGDASPPALRRMETKTISVPPRFGRAMALDAGRAPLEQEPAGAQALGRPQPAPQNLAAGVGTNLPAQPYPSSWPQGSYPAVPPQTYPATFPQAAPAAFPQIPAAQRPPAYPQTWPQASQTFPQAAPAARPQIPAAQRPPAYPQTWPQASQTFPQAAPAALPQIPTTAQRPAAYPQTWPQASAAALPQAAVAQFPQIPTAPQAFPLSSPQASPATFPQAFPPAIGQQPNASLESPPQVLPPQARFSPSRSPVAAGAPSPPTPDRAAWQPYLAASPFRPGECPP
jgi:hypothetical protein